MGQQIFKDLFAFDLRTEIRYRTFIWDAQN